MHISARTYLTSGIAAVGAGAIALSPIQPVPDHMSTAAPQRAVETMAVTLAASIDPFTPWVDTFKTSFANLDTLGKFWVQKPFPVLQTFGANLGTYFTELFNGNAGLIPGQIFGNIKALWTAPWDPGRQVTLTQADNKTELTIPYVFCDTSSSCSETTQKEGVDTQYLWLSAYQIIGGASAENPLTNEGPLPLETIWNGFLAAQPALNLLFSPASGQALGVLGPLLSPAIQLVRSLSASWDYLTKGAILEAINEIINIPAKTTNAFLNGAGFLDLTPIVTAVLGGPLPVFPGIISKDFKVGINLGGLLNVVPRNGSLADPDQAPTEWFGLGIDGLSILDTPGNFFGPDAQGVFGYPNGFLGSGIAMTQYMSEQLLVTPPVKASATVAPAAAATVEAPATPSVPDTTPAIPATPAIDTTPAVPATPATPDIPAGLEESGAPEAPAAPAVADAPTHRGGGSAGVGGGNDNTDNGSRGKGHRG